MATGLPSNLYSGGSVVFDSQPYINFYAQSMARKQAKDEALDQYYQNVFKQVNPAGARTQDIPRFTEKVNEWQNFYQQNRDKIKNPRLDGGKAQSEFQSRLVDAQNYIQQSKNEAKTYQDIVPILRDPDKRSRLPDQVIQDLALHDLPLGDPNRKSFNASALNFDPKPFDVKAQGDFIKGVGSGIKLNEKVTVGPTDPKTLMQTITSTSSLDDNGKEAIRNKAAGAYATDPSVKQFVDKELSKPGNYQQLNDVFKKAYGVDIQHPEDLMTAWTLGSVQHGQVKEKSQPDVFARQKYMEAVRFGHQKEMAQFSKQLKEMGEADQGAAIDELYEGIKQDALNNKREYKTASGKVSTQYEMKTPPGVRNLLARTDPAGHKIYPDAIRLSEDMKTVTPIFFEKYTDEKGKPTTETVVDPKTGKAKVITELSQPLLEEDFKQRWKKEILGVGAFGKSLQNKPLQKTTTITYKISGKPYSHKQLNDMGYDDTEIQDAIKQGLIQQ